MKKCIYGRQECQLIKIGSCPREAKCPFAAMEKAKSLPQKGAVIKTSQKAAS